jgi:hypothetical protein
VEGLDQVNLREDIAALHFGREVHHVGQGVPVRDSDGFELLVVTTWLP